MDEQKQGDQEHQTTAENPSQLQSNSSDWRPPKPTKCICDGSGEYVPDWPEDHESFGATDYCFCKLERRKEQRRKRGIQYLEAAHIPRRYGGIGLTTMDTTHPDTKMMVDTALRYLAHGLWQWLVDELPDELIPFFDGDKPAPPEMLALFGRYGSGKTLIAACIARGFAREAVSSRYAYVPDLLDELRASYRTKDEEGGFYELVEKLKNVNVLVLDDIGAEKSSDWADEQLEKIVDYRYRECKHTVITTNMEISQLPPRIADRLTEPKACMCVVSKAPSYRPKSKR